MEHRALHIPHAYPTDWLKQVADFYKGSNLVVGTKRRIAGLAGLVDLHGPGVDILRGRESGPAA